MKDSKYIKDDEGDDAKDDAEADGEGDLFKKKTHKHTKFAHSKGFQGPPRSFARKKKRVS